MKVPLKSERHPDELRTSDDESEDSGVPVGPGAAGFFNPAASYASLQAFDSRPLHSGALAIGAFLLLSIVGPRMPDSSLPWTFSPTGRLSIVSYLVLYLLSIPAKELLNRGLDYLFGEYLCFRRMDQDNDKVKRLEHLQTIDKAYLALNTLVEFIGLNHVAAVLIDHSLDQGLRSFNFTNGPVAFFVAMLLNDVLYYPIHVLAHSRMLYPYWHKQHHRNLIPFRGYADAANQHPIEVTYGFFIFIASLKLTRWFVGLHNGTALCAALAWVVLNIANYLPYDSNIHLPLPYPAFPRDLQMHTRFQKCNYSTLTSLCDQLAGTFMPYKALDEPEPEPPKPLMWYEKSQDPAAPKEEAPSPLEKIGRPDFFPSPWSFAGLMVYFIVVTVILDIFATGGPPSWNEFLTFAKSAIVLSNLGLLCAAIENACSTEAQPKNKKKCRVYTKPTMKDKKSLKEAVAPGHHRQFIGGKDVFQPRLSDAVQAKTMKRE